MGHELDYWSSGKWGSTFDTFMWKASDQLAYFLKSFLDTAEQKLLRKRRVRKSYDSPRKQDFPATEGNNGTT
jgi:hypothetical protein